MKNYVIPVILVLASLCVVSCSKTDNEMHSQSASLSFEWTHLVKKEGDCSSEKSPCLTIDLKYPIATGGGDSIRHALNAYMEHYVNYTLRSYASDNKDSLVTNDALIQRLVDGYKDFVREYPDAPSQWAIELKSSIIRNDSTVISLSTNVYTYLGGAHPLGVMDYTSFFTATGQKVRLDDITSSKQQLTALAEQVFRREKELAPTTNLDSAGFWFGDDGFSLPNNFALTDSSLIFYYNPYEIAPYAFGPTTIELPYSSLKGLVDERLLHQ